MADEAPEIAPQPQAETPVLEPSPVAPTAPATPPKKSHKTFWIIAASVIGVLCLCGMAVVALAVPAFIQVLQAKPPVTSVLDSFMRRIVAKDTQGAYALFSPRAQRQMPLDKIQQLMQGNNYAIFDGYQSLTIDELNLVAAANTNPDAPQGTLAKVTGTVSYAGGFKGTLTGTLEKVNGQWLIYSVNVVVPPDKFGP